MEKMRVIFNRNVNTLDVWFDDPEKEFISEEIILKKGKSRKDNRVRKAECVGE